MLEVGSIAGGKFRIERILGQGGMGLVAVATHLQLDQLVALKVLHDPMLGDTEIIERFMREARASARLRSEHVCKVSDVGQLDDGAPYLVMELLEGSDLAGVIAGGTLQVATACEYVLQACVAVAEAHALGIVHRDLKPANLFLTRRFDGTPLVKVLDFGIAKASSASDFKITKTSTIMGSPGYMSPEQLRSTRDVDARSDIWALGVILYELVTGHLPFRGDSITELAVKVVVDPPEPLGVDAPAFAAIVYRCLAKELDRRYPDVAALAADLAPLVGEPGRRTAMLVANLSQSMPRPSTSPALPTVPTSSPTQHTTGLPALGGAATSAAGPALASRQASPPASAAFAGPGPSAAMSAGAFAGTHPSGAMSAAGISAGASAPGFAASHPSAGMSAGMSAGASAPGFAASHPSAGLSAQHPPAGLSAQQSAAMSAAQSTALGTAPTAAGLGTFQPPGASPSAIGTAPAGAGLTGAGLHGQPTSPQPAAHPYGQPTGPQPATHHGQPTGDPPATHHYGQPTGDQPATHHYGQPTGLQPAGSLYGQPTSAHPAAPSRRKRRLALAMIVVALAAVAAAVVVFAVRSPGSRHPHHDPAHAGSGLAALASTGSPGAPASTGSPGAPASAGSPGAPASAAPASTGSPAAPAALGTPAAAIDAGLAPSAAAAPDPRLAEVRDNLHALAAKQDWPAVLAFTDLASGDPEIAGVIADAKQQYLAQQTHAIDAQVKAGQCARAKQLADATLKIVTDDTTLEPRAKACKPRAATPATIEDADAALARADYPKALELAEQLLKADPNSEPAARVATIAACGAKNVDKATRYSAKLSGADRTAARTQCRKDRIDLAGDDPESGDASDAQNAERTGQWDKALSVAQNVLKRQPRNVIALIAAIDAACHLGRDKLAHDLFRRVPPLRQARVRELCAGQSVEL